MKNPLSQFGTCLNVLEPLKEARNKKTKQNNNSSHSSFIGVGTSFYTERKTMLLKPVELVYDLNVFTQVDSLFRQEEINN